MGSRRSPAEQLGVRPGSQLGLLDAPAGWALGGLPPAVHVRHDVRGPRDVTIAFVRSARELTRTADRCARALAPDAALWLAWPKRAAGHHSDITEDLLREAFVSRGLIDVEVAAIDEDWSGLKFVRRPSAG